MLLRSLANLMVIFGWLFPLPPVFLLPVGVASGQILSPSCALLFRRAR